MSKWLTVAELSELIGVPRGTIQNKCAARQWPHHRPGRHLRFSPADVAAIDAMTAEPVAKPASPIEAEIRRLTAVPRATHPPAGPQTPPPPPGPKEPRADQNAPPRPSPHPGSPKPQPQAPPPGKAAAA